MVLYKESSFKMVQEDSGSVRGRLRYQGMVERMTFDKQTRNVSTVRGGGKWQSRFKVREKGRDRSCGWNWN